MYRATPKGQPLLTSPPAGATQNPRRAWEPPLSTSNQVTSAKLALFGRCTTHPCARNYAQGAFAADHWKTPSNSTAGAQPAATLCNSMQHAPNSPAPATRTLLYATSCNAKATERNHSGQPSRYAMVYEANPNCTIGSARRLASYPRLSAFICGPWFFRNEPTRNRCAGAVQATGCNAMQHDAACSEVSGAPHEHAARCNHMQRQSGGNATMVAGRRGMRELRSEPKLHCALFRNEPAQNRPTAQKIRPIVLQPAPPSEAKPICTC
jgi:hypothetical protein